MFHSLLPLLFICIVFSLPRLSTAACYFPNGNLSPNDTPCRDDTSQSLCCGQGYACLTNGICQATGEELQKPGATEFVRGGCTDKTFRSSNCPSFCAQDGVDNTGGGMGMGKCQNTTKDMYWCIDRNQKNVDCDKELNILFFPGSPSAITTIGVSPSTSSVSTSAASETNDATSTTSDSPSSATSNDDPTNDEKKDDSKKIIIGSVVGGVGGLVLGSLAVWLFFRHRGRRKSSENNGHIPPNAMAPHDAQYDYQGKYQQYYNTTSISNTTSQIGPFEAPTTSSINLPPSSTTIYETSSMRSPQEMPTGFNVRR